MKHLDLEGFVAPPIHAQGRLVSIIHSLAAPYHRLVLTWPDNVPLPFHGTKTTVRVMLYEPWERPCAFCGAVLTQDWDALLTNAPAGCEGPDCCTKAGQAWRERREIAFDAILQATREESAGCNDPT